MFRFSTLLIALCLWTTKAKADNFWSYEEFGSGSEPIDEQCCIDMQSQIDEINGQVAALQSQVSSLQNQVEQIEVTINFTSPKQSCEQYKLMSYDSGYYEIDPDGADGAIPPFQVYCDMTSDPEWAVTMLGHDSEERTYVRGCQDPGCFSHDVTYDQTWEQIQAVMWTSRSCQQYLSYECLGSMMFSYNDYAWWVSRDGEEQHYWAGADPGSKMCECGKKGTCEGKATTCNCDNNDLVWRQDDGYLTSKDTLPATQLFFGDVLGVEERGYFTLGKLECKGEVSTKDCTGLKSDGNPSGYYTIAPGAGVQPFEVYCDMDSYPGTGITVVHHDKESQSSQLYYYTDNDIEVNYNATMVQIGALINGSNNCEQYIEWQCRGTGMLYSGYTWWISRQGDKMTYWGGADPTHDGYCACGETGSCQPGNSYYYKCNCDYTGTSTIRVDAGYLYDKNVLPVTGMHYGFYTTSSSYYGYYTLGPLKCY
uniref:uncharacterized protein LOC120338192 n=1 Tax=Styela clava TaxID=7725 RepID=UPI00193ABFF2|nr:uncharacterized protein LOC120338192 [Styela clava]